MKYILRATPNATSKRTSVLKSMPSKLLLLDMLINLPPSRQCLSMYLLHMWQQCLSLHVNHNPCNTMLSYLTNYFHPTTASNSTLSLAIHSSRDGTRLSHDHTKLFAYVQQSLTLWHEILNKLSETVGYWLRDTGQGLNRVQAVLKTSRITHAILHKAWQSIGHWVGSTDIHMRWELMASVLKGHEFKHSIETRLIHQHWCCHRHIFGGWPRWNHYFILCSNTYAFLYPRIRYVAVSSMYLHVV